MIHVAEGALESVAGEEVRTLEASAPGRSETVRGYEYRARDQQGVVFYSVAVVPHPPRG